MMKKLWFAGIALVAACGGGVPEPPVVRDSAGVTIIENIEPQWRRSDAWSVSEEPVLVIGDSAGDANYLFSQITGAVRMSDGTMVVANDGTKELRWYDGTGASIVTVGGARGDVEFTDIEWLGRYDANSILVCDGDFRLSIFDGAGNLQHSNSLVLTFQASPGSIRGAFSDSSLLVVRGLSHWVRSMRAEGNTPQGLMRGPTSVFRYSAADGQLMNGLGTYTGSEQVFRSGRTQWGRAIARPFGRDAVVAVRGIDLIVGTQDEFEIRIITNDDSLKSLVHVARENAPVTQEQIDRYKRARLANVHPRERADREAELDARPYPETMPAYGSILVDTEGNLWVADYRPFGTEPQTWTVFDSHNRMLGSVETPIRLYVFDIGHDYILGSSVDQARVERIQMYALNKPGA